MTESVRVITPMAKGALEEGVVRGSAHGIGVAIGADTACSIIAVIDWKPRVIKRRRQPTGRVVTRSACGWDNSGDGGVDGEVVRYRPAQRCGALPLSGVAIVAIGWRPSRTDVAKVASQWWGHVRAGQRETGGAVVKDRAQP